MRAFGGAAAVAIIMGAGLLMSGQARARQSRRPRVRGPRERRHRRRPVDGIKTGDTQVAGSCLLFETTRNGTTLIGVVLDDPSFKVAASDAEEMMDWGWNI